MSLSVLKLLTYLLNISGFCSDYMIKFDIKLRQNYFLGSAAPVSWEASTDSICFCQFILASMSSGFEAI